MEVSKRSHGYPSLHVPAQSALIGPTLIRKVDKRAFANPFQSFTLCCESTEMPVSTYKLKVLLGTLPALLC